LGAAYEGFVKVPRTSMLGAGTESVGVGLAVPGELPVALDFS
jgi:hypothetical protein